MIKVRQHLRKGKVVKQHARKKSGLKKPLLVSHPMGNNPKGKYTAQESKNLLTHLHNTKAGLSKSFDSSLKAMRNAHKKKFGKDFNEK